MSAETAKSQKALSASQKLRAWRMTKDVIARYFVAFGGTFVLFALLIIFVYLFMVVFPLFRPASLHAVAEYKIPGGTSSRTLHLSMEEQHEIGARFTSDGRVIFFKTESGIVVSEHKIPIPTGVNITCFAAGFPKSGIFAFGLSNGSAIIAEHSFKVTYPNDTRLITPHVSYPFGEIFFNLDPASRPLIHMAVQVAEDKATVAASTDAGGIEMLRLEKKTSFLSDEPKIAQNRVHVCDSTGEVMAILLTPAQKSLYIAHPHGELDAYDITDIDQPERIQSVRITEGDEGLSSIDFLAGGISIIAGTTKGRIVQWFPVRDENNRRILTFVRDFRKQAAPIVSLAPEHGRKGFLAADSTGILGIYHSTAWRTLCVKQITSTSIGALAVSPRADAMLAEAGERLCFFLVGNEHPDISWHVLWQKVWYEDYPEPQYVWQSSAANDDFEPKFSLVPITFGTLKASFYAMLFAIPMSILGAIYTAQFMRPEMRAIVKPSIEIMEALPTVIIGFLAGLWLAPYVENHLLTVFILIFTIFPAIFFSSYVWSRLPMDFRNRVPEGWEAAILMPVILLACLVAQWMSPFLEKAVFGGNFRGWITATLGISYDQRNCLIVGIAMGFAVIPNIFTITEDAIFGVPKHLTHGSLALGATPWQTLQRVVLLTASPGIFSAIMIGLGRAVGETMIVLMATGNTPVMDWNIFQGFRSLSANIAVEMPEAEVGSTHFRILFLSALVLFGMTFFFNTLAEIVRNKLRKKYSSL